jgi:hypothetical protein
VDVLEHLQSVDERRASANRHRHVDSFGHLLEIGALLERILRIGVDAVRSLDGVRHGERDQRLLANRKGALRKPP